MHKALFISMVALGLLLFSAVAVYAAPNEWTTVCHHIVQPGETVYCIARGYLVSPWAIATHNGISNPNVIYPGQVLAIPGAYAWLPPGPTCPRQCPPETVTCACASYHTITTYENLYRISLHYGVSMWRIAECNSIFNLHLIQAGDVLCIPAAP